MSVFRIVKLVLDLGDLGANWFMTEISVLLLFQNYFGAGELSRINPDALKVYKQNLGYLP